MEKYTIPRREEISLSEDRETLERKLQEYKGRLDPYIPPEHQLDTIYKIAVLEPLVETGTVRQTEVREALQAKYGFVVDMAFSNAWGVIVDYVETGGRKLHGGTGLERSRDC
jgi:hypothetical protein